VSQSFDPGALLGSSFTLDTGVRVRLRLARSSDTALIGDLVARLGGRPDELELARLVQFDPRRRVVICATALIDSTETLVAVGAAELDGTGEHEVVIVDAEQSEALTRLLAAVLAFKVTAAVASRAA
jgi:hypothetical protein